ncbi:phage tail spike protein [Alkalibacillus almallahensis]|uniref:phage tail spike protein n=1 Tax=Alkalibacillus almallahensis TaxID=1379154 RepID=UPI00141F45AF|nr:phage tail spike protein [Alkalibacillus almallahensis]NIK10929.1 phage minor structural protein [Alkalibacillus almallahensis]
MSQIHILGGQNDEILDVITKQNIRKDVHKQSLKDKLETFDFTTFANKRFSQYLEKRNRLIIPGEDGEYREFIMHEVIKDINRQSEVYAKASYLELKKQAIIYPQTFNAQSATQMVGHATDGTEWQPGLIEITNVRTFNVESHRNPFAFLKTIANEFDAELRFRIVTDGNRVVARYVDLLKRRGEWQGREVTSGKDLASIKRTERTDNVYTALVGIGPEREDGSRLEVTVEDQDALKRWGRRDKNGNLQHLIGTYEPQSTRQDMTESELEQYTRTELNKRINAVVEFEADIVDLEHVPGLENKRFRFGDTIKIKDTGFEPPLYLEARIFEQERSIVDKSAKKVKLGDFTELTEEEVQNVWKQLQSEIAKKIDAAETYDKTTIDSKDQTVFEDGKTFAEVQASNALEDAKADAKQKANEAQTAAEEYALAKANLAETEAEAYADGIVSDEEQARINQAEANLQEAKQHAETKASEAQSAAEAYTDTQLTNYVQATQYDSDISDIQAQIDNQITSHFKNYAPTLSNEPASQWTTDNEKDKHVGDLFYDTDTGYSYRFAKNNGTYEWIQVRDEGINKALQDASEAQDTADSKRRVFVSQPNTPYDKGDLWDNNGSIYRSTVSKSTSGSFSSSDWILIGDVTGENTSKDTSNVDGRPSSTIEDKQGAQNKADNAEQNAKNHADTVSDQALTDAQNYAVAQTAYDTKMDEIANDLSAKAGVEYVDGQLQLKQGEIPQQDTEPSNPNTGMLWLDTSQSPNVMKRYDGSGWVKATPTDASEVGSYTIAEVDNALSNKVSVTQYDSDMDGVISDIQSNSTLIGQNEDAIALKADSSRVDTLEGTVSNHSTELSVMSDEIELKAESSRVDTLEGTVDNHTAELSVMSDEIDLRVEKNGVIGSINLSEENLKIDVEQVAIQGDLEVSEGNLVLKDGSVTAPKISSREITSEKLLLGNFDNMLENPNFLNNISPHSLQRGTWTLDNNKSHTGKTSLKCTGVDAGDEARVYLGGADAIVVQEGEQYQFSTHVIKTGNSPHNDMVVSLRFADEDLNFVGYEGTTWFYSNDFSHNEWTQINVTGRVPDGAFYVQPTIRIMDDGNNPSYQIDSVKLKSLVDGKLVAGTIESVDINGSTFTASSGEDGYVRINDAGWYVVDGNDEIRIGINTKGQSWSQPAPSILWFFPNDNSSENYIGLQESDDAPLTIHSTNKLILSAAELSMSPITSDLDVQAKLTIERSGSSFNLKSEGTGTSATTYVDFIDANSDRLGYFGYGSTGNTVFYISNNIGDEVRIVGDMNATGSKSAIVETENYGNRKMYAVEAPDVRFMDVIEVTLDQGEHWVNLNYIFAETINGYSVFPIVQNGGQVRILERENQRFKLYVADDNTEVACWIYGKREGYEDIYLEQVEEVA